MPLLGPIETFIPLSPVTIRRGGTAAQLADRGLIAANALARAWGLLGRQTLEEGAALVIPRCNMVHMWFMRFAIDVVFCTPDHRVAALQSNLRPWRFSKLVRASNYVIELPAGMIIRSGLQVGDLIEFERRIVEATASGR